MAREKKKKQPLPKTAKERHGKMARMAQADPSIYSSLNALKEPPKTKHTSYFEIVENSDKQDKKLETQVTTDRQPPPGFEFVASGNPELNTACKELSREQDALIFIVSQSKGDALRDQVGRVGYHFRQKIVDQARERLRAKGVDVVTKRSVPGRPEAIPQDRAEVMRQADAVLRDLFPRIPNIDRAEILHHSFNKDEAYFNGGLKVGMAENLPLTQRVQLAALSHIRHTKTRYDELLREGHKWENARKAVEKPCLDIIVKWRGDEETGRDQLDEILREVIEISDDEDDSEDETSGEEVRPVMPAGSHVLPQEPAQSPQAPSAQRRNREESLVLLSPGNSKKATRKERKAARKARQRFKRYYQAAETLRQRSPVPSSPINDPAPNVQSMGKAVRDREQPGSFQLSRDSVNYSYPPEQIGRFDGASTQFVQTHNNLAWDKQRGASPMYVRELNDGLSRVELTSRSKGNSLVPVPPRRHHLQDMLVESIEPRSPVVLQKRGYETSNLPHSTTRATDAPRVVSETILHRPVEALRPVSPWNGYRAEDVSAKRRRVTHQFDRSEPFSEAGFIQVNRVPTRTDSERPVSYIALAPREVRRPVHASVVYVDEPIYADHSRALPRTGTDPVHLNNVVEFGRGNLAHTAESSRGPGPIFVREALRPGQEPAYPRSRDRPIVLDDHYSMDPDFERRDYPESVQYDKPQARGPGLMDDPRNREIRRISPRPKVIYLNGPDPGNPPVHTREDRGRSPLPLQTRPSDTYATMHSYQAIPGQPREAMRLLASDRRDIEREPGRTATHQSSLDGGDVMGSIAPRTAMAENVRYVQYPTLSNWEAQPATYRQAPEHFRQDPLDRTH